MELSGSWRRLAWPPGAPRARSCRRAQCPTWACCNGSSRGEAGSWTQLVLLAIPANSNSLSETRHKKRATSLIYAPPLQPGQPFICNSHPSARPLARNSIFAGEKLFARKYWRPLRLGPREELERRPQTRRLKSKVGAH